MIFLLMILSALNQKSKRSEAELYGRNENNTKVIFPKQDVPVEPHALEHRAVSSGDYVIAQVCSSASWCIYMV